MATKIKRWVLESRFSGLAKESNFKLVEEDLPPIQDGEYLCEALFWSVDPYMRIYSSAEIGKTMIGQQVARVTASKNPAYPVGSIVLGVFGWRTHTIVPKVEGGLPTALGRPTILHPALNKFSPSLALGVLGMTGETAYFGLLRICDPKPGETVLVNGAAGAVGSLVGQIAKIKGCKVIGYAGSDDKVQWLKSELGFDHAFNYRTTDLSKSLSEAAPEGIDCFFDNVGGEFFNTVVNKHMKLFGRVSICGYISGYNSEKPGQPFDDKVPFPFGPFLQKQLRIEGFIVGRWLSEFSTAIKDMAEWVEQGKLKHKEHVTDGFENMPKALIGLFKSENTGKAIVKAVA